jgi:probable phosphoglycerate mutase
MAAAFADAYRDTTWRAIYCSRLRRSIATAQPLCDAVGVPSHPRAELNEIGYGRWEGLSKEEVDRTFHADYVNWLDDPARHAPTGGELAATVAGRGLRLVEEIKETCSEGNVLWVSHKATIRIILCSLFGIEVGRFRYRLACPVGSVSVVEFDAHGPMLKTLADRSHLNTTLRALPGT